MKLRFCLANKKTREFWLPNNVRIHRAMMWVEEDGKKKVETKVIMIPDEVRTIEVLGDDGETCAISRGQFVKLRQSQNLDKRKSSWNKGFIAGFDTIFQKGPQVKYQNPDAW